MTPVLLVTPRGTPGGAERALTGLARRLPEFGFRPVVALIERGPAEGWLAEAGSEVVVVPAHGRGGRARAIRSLELLAGRVRAEIVVSNKWEGHLLGGAAAAEAGLPAVWWQQDIAQTSEGELEAATIPARVIVCSSDFAVEAQREQTPEAAIEKVHLGAPVEEIAARKGTGAPVREVLGWTERPVVGIVGRLEPWKGQDTFLRAARIVSERFPETRFAIVGGALIGTEGSYPEDLRRLAEDLGLDGRVHFAGHQADVYPWFDALDVAVHASHGEPFGLVVLEAMALGKPVVATAPGGPTEIVEDGASGLLISSGEAEATAAAVCRLLDDPTLAARLGREAERRARLFSEERMAEAFSAVLRRVLGAAGADSR